jgi:hypothetical protein
MAVSIVFVVVIIGLIAYVIFLHKQLSERNIFIETTVKKLSVIEKSRSIDEMMSFLREIQDLSRYSPLFTNKLLEDNTLKFILDNGKNLKIFIHYTREERDARNIINSGFRFADSFYKTALPVTRDKLDFKIKHSSRRLYGDFIIVICISADVANYYSYELEKAGIRNSSFENILTESLPSRNDNSDLVYQLSPKFIKGYINHRTGEIVRNPSFDPHYNSPGFMKNIDLLKS